MRKWLVSLFAVCAFGASLTAQAKVIEVLVGSSIWKGDSTVLMHLVRISTDDAGIITSIKEILGTKETDLARIYRGDAGEIVVETKGGRKSTITRLDKSTLLLSGLRFVSQENEPLRISVEPKSGIVYESSMSRLQRVDKDTLVENLTAIPGNRMGYRFYRDTLFVDYRSQNNVNYKYRFDFKPEHILATYYYRSGQGLTDEDFDEYSPPIEIRGQRLATSDATSNVINHFILVATDAILTAALFPSNFVDE